MRIALEIRRTLDLKAQGVGRRVPIYRLWARVRFRRLKGWSEDHLAIVDTGAPYSVIPASLWPTLETEGLIPIPLRGIVPGKEAKVNATLGKISGRILDAGNASPILPIWAMLVRTEPVPLILGWAGFLDRGKLILDPRRQNAWMEF